MEQARLRKEARAAAPQGKGFARVFSRKPMVPPKMMAGLAAQAQANMPATGAPTMDGRPEVMGDSSDNTSQFKKGGMTKKKKPMVTKKMAAGGSASRRADGCATKGKTKGRFV
jgi:hypothetical protein